MKLVQLHDRLFIRGHTRHVNTRSVFKTLREHGIVLVMNVALINDENLQRLIHCSRGTPLVYRHEPLSDSRVIDVSRVHHLARVVHLAMRFGPVLVHCDAGRNRSSLIAILALMRYTGRSARVLIDEARVLRPGVLANTTFEQFVIAQEGVLQ